MKSLIVTAVLGLVLAAIPAPSSGEEMSVPAPLEADAEGTFRENGVNGMAGTWTAAAELVEGRLKGAVMIDGEAVEFDTAVVDGSFEFPVEVSGNQGQVSGRVTGSSASGSYAFGSRQGTWSGTIENAPAP